MVTKQEAINRLDLLRDTIIELKYQRQIVQMQLSALDKQILTLEQEEIKAENFIREEFPGRK